MTTKLPSLGHHKPTGQAYVRLNGQMLYLGPWGRPDTTQRYLREIAEWIARGRQLKVSPHEITVMELCAAYSEHAQSYYLKPDGAPTSELQRINMALRGLKGMYGDMPAAQFGPNALRALRESWVNKEIESKNTHVKKRLSRKTVNDYAAEVKRCFKWGVSHELIPGTVYHALAALEGLRQGRSEARETAPVKPVLQKYIDAAKKHTSRQVAALIDLQLLTAARSGELLGLRPIDFDTSGKVWRATIRDHKTAYYGKERVLYFGPKAQALVKDFMGDRPLDACLFSPREAETERYANAKDHRHQEVEQPKTERRLRDRYTPDTYRQAIEYACRNAAKEAAKAAGKEGDTEYLKDLVKKYLWTPHRLRHNAATEIRRQYGLEAAQVMLGHARADVTQIYAEINSHKALEIAAQMG